MEHLPKELLKYPLLYAALAIPLIGNHVGLPHSELIMLAPLLGQVVLFVVQARRKHRTDVIERGESTHPERERQREKIAAESVEPSQLELWLLEPNEKDEAELDRMLASLKSMAGPRHKLYSRLALEYWVIGKFEKAILCSEMALTLFKQSGEAGESEELGLKNSLAYYYAESGAAANAQAAFEYSEEVVRRRQNVGGRSLGSALATQGLVMIVYADTSAKVLEGLGLCIDGWRLGASRTLCKRHLRRAYRRLEELAAAA